MLKDKLNVLLAQHAHIRINGKVASARTMELTGEVLNNFFNTCWHLGYRLEDPKNIGDRHIRAVVREWWLNRRISSKTLQNNLSRLRIFCRWIGKKGLVQKPWAYLPEVPKSSFVVSGVATSSKAWTSNGVDVAAKIREAFQKDLRVGCMLLMQLVFGLRRKEALHCRPWVADRGTALRVYPGESKGSRPRDIPIETEFQRAVLQKVQSHFGKTKAMGWEYMSDGSRATFKQKEKKYENALRRLGITKNDAGVTGHGLRAQYCENKAILDEFVPATLGGTESSLELETLKVRRLQVSEALGHSRDSVTTAYYGKTPRVVRGDDSERFRKMIEDAVAVVESSGRGTAPEVRSRECLSILEMLQEDGLDLRLGQIHALWSKFSERFGVEWIKPETGVREGLEVAARQTIEEHAAQTGTTIG